MTLLVTMNEVEPFQRIMWSQYHTHIEKLSYTPVHTKHKLNHITNLWISVPNRYRVSEINELLQKAVVNFSFLWTMIYFTTPNDICWNWLNCISALKNQFLFLLRHRFSHLLSTVQIFRHLLFHLCHGVNHPLGNTWATRDRRDLRKNVLKSHYQPDFKILHEF